MRQKGGRVAILALLAGVTGLSLLYTNTAFAEQIQNRKLTLQAGSSDGGSKPGGTVNHLFEFTLPSVGDANVGSILFEYCTEAADAGTSTCTRPTGLDAQNATLGAENGATSFNGLTASDTTVAGAGGSGEVNSVLLTRASTSSVAADTDVSYRLDDIVNPTTANETFFVRIYTFASTDGTGPSTDIGTVAATTATEIQLSGTMPESLIFCTGSTVPVNGSVPDCANASSGAVAFGQLFSPSETAVASSQMAASTNAAGGYSITVNGGTLESGANSIAAMSAAAASSTGVAQFGMNLVENTSTASSNFAPAPSANIFPTSDGVNLRGQATTGYNTADSFKFATGDVVANSGFNTLGATNGQVFTVSYIVNVPGSQAAGSYTTTLTYICTPTF